MLAQFSNATLKFNRKNKNLLERAPQHRPFSELDQLAHYDNKRTVCMFAEQLLLISTAFTRLDSDNRGVVLCTEIFLPASARLRS